MIDTERAIEYFYRQMERGLIENDTQQEIYELAIEALQLQEKIQNATSEIDRKILKLDWGEVEGHKLLLVTVAARIVE